MTSENFEDPIIPHKPSDFIFGETRVRSIWPGPTSPHRDGTFVEIIKRGGRFNHGTYVRLTDCKGEFWEQEIGNVTIWQRGDTDETVTERANRMVEMIRKKRGH